MPSQSFMGERVARADVFYPQKPRPVPLTYCPFFRAGLTFPRVTCSASVVATAAVAPGTCFAIVVATAVAAPGTCSAGVVAFAVFVQETYFSSVHEAYVSVRVSDYPNLPRFSVVAPGKGPGVFGAWIAAIVVAAAVAVPVSDRASAVSTPASVRAANFDTSAVSYATAVVLGVGDCENVQSVAVPFHAVRVSSVASVSTFLLRDRVAPVSGLPSVGRLS